MDPLTDLLDGVRARTAAFCQTILEPPWGLRIEDGAALAFATVMRGHAWIVPDHGEPVPMQLGDVAVVKGPTPYTVADHPDTTPDIVVNPGNRLTTPDGTDVTEQMRLGPRLSGRSEHGTAVVASGTYQVSSDVTGKLLEALPDIVVVPAAEVQDPVMRMLAEEVGRDGPGQQVVLDRMLDIALVATLRAWFARAEAAAPGWYDAHTDPVAGPALRALHEDPARGWTVEDLAAHVGCSRAALARRFTASVGEPPMAYLAGWRISLAADMLRSSDRTISSIAHEVGYSNAFALSVAFKRVRGHSPKQYRDGALAVVR